MLPLKLLLLSLLLLQPAHSGEQEMLAYCQELLERLHNHPAVYAGCDSGECTKNVRRVLEVFQHASHQGKPLDLSKAKVIFIRQIEPLRGRRFWAENWRQLKQLDVLHHTVLALMVDEGKVLDLDYGAGNELVPLKDYFQKMFPNEWDHLAIATMDADDFMQHYAVTETGMPLEDHERAIWNQRYETLEYVPLK